MPQTQYVLSAEELTRVCREISEHISYQVYTHVKMDDSEAKWLEGFAAIDLPANLSRILSGGYPPRV